MLGNEEKGVPSVSTLPPPQGSWWETVHSALEHKFTQDVKKEGEMREGPRRREGQGREKTVTDRDTERWKERDEDIRGERHEKRETEPTERPNETERGGHEGRETEMESAKRHKGREGETRGRLRETETEKRQIGKGRKKRN